MNAEKQNASLQENRKMKDKNKFLNGIAYALLTALILVTGWGLFHKSKAAEPTIADGIENVDLDTIYLENSEVEVSFADVILSKHNETHKVIVSTQKATASTELTDRLIEKLDFDFMKKSQKISYTGTGYFTVALDDLTADRIVEDKDAKIVTIRIKHAQLDAIEIDPNKIIIDEVKESLMARGDIKLTVADYNMIERELRKQIEAKCNTAANVQRADDLALQMVKEIYEPVVRAVNHRYSVRVEFV